MDMLAGIFLLWGVYSLLVFIVIFYVLTVIACWKIYKKAGEPGWKSLIPIYNEYILFKISWKTGVFWFMLFVGILGSVLMSCDPGVVSYYSTANAEIAVNDYSIVYYIGNALVLVAYIISAVCFYQVGRSFGHGLPFFILAFFLPNIALLYLGFSGDYYRGNMTTGQNARY